MVLGGGRATVYRRYQVMAKTLARCRRDEAGGPATIAPPPTLTCRLLSCTHVHMATARICRMLYDLIDLCHYSCTSLIGRSLCVKNQHYHYLPQRYKL